MIYTSDVYLPFLSRLVACMLCGLMASCPQQTQTQSTSHGTLVVFVPSKMGLLVCADKRSWNPMRGARDTETKIRTLGQKSAFVVTGSVEVLDSKNWGTMFSVRDVISEHFKDLRSKRFVNKLDTLPGVLENAYRAFVRQDGIHLEPSPGSTDDVIYSVTIWYVLSGHLRIKQIQLHAGDDLGKMTYNDVTEALSQQISLDGQSDFILAAIRKSDPRFAAFKADPEIKTVWTNTNPVNLKTDLAERVARRMIGSTNTFHSMVSSFPTMVSATADCSLMNHTTGFKWLK